MGEDVRPSALIHRETVPQERQLRTERGMTYFEHEKPWRYTEGELTVTRGSAWSAPGCHLGCGDLFLPVTTYPERNGIRVGDGTQRGETINQAAPPRGECRSDMEINLELGRRWNPEAWPWESVEDMFSHILGETGMDFSGVRDTAPPFPLLPPPFAPFDAPSRPSSWRSPRRFALDSSRIVGTSMKRTWASCAATRDYFAMCENVPHLGIMHRLDGEHVAWERAI